MPTFWLLTWTTYGTWLPGGRRGFVGNVRVAGGAQETHNTFATPYDGDMDRLEQWTRNRMTGEPVALTTADALAMIDQYQETARIRKWDFVAASVMFNHTHILVGMPSVADPDTALETLKGWATRAIKKHRPTPPNGTFWTVKGSARKRKDERAIRAGVVYVMRKQPNPLAAWCSPAWQWALDEYDAKQTAVRPGSPTE